MELQIKIKGVEKVINDLRNVGRDLEAYQVAHEMATLALTLMLPRIQKGIDVEGRKFPPYSTRPIYVSWRRPGFRKLKNDPRGKTGRTHFRNGRLHRSRYFPGGYAELRRYMGRRLDDDRLILTGRMLNSMTVDMMSGGAIIHFSRDEEDAKARGNQERYNFFGLTKEEREQVVRLGQKRFEEIMGRHING